ncbi:MAG: dephospho-CoA kinase [Tannerella sp.]|jgi:dephospho-CoA kinase|nr:dephospho-CoA kinase [Tannerella sp.]
MITIGLTGGIGSGKTQVATLFRTYGIPVYVADEESKRLTATSPVLRRQLIALLGDSIYDTNGLNRKQMASLIFNDAKLLEQVNAIIHPAVTNHFLSWAQGQRAKEIVLESAILFESGFDRLMNRCVAVYAPQALRIQRVMARDGVTEADVRRRIENQWPDEVKKERADYEIFNDGIQALIPQVEKFIAQLP